jgi:hypothetical protein
VAAALGPLADRALPAGWDRWAPAEWERYLDAVLDEARTAAEVRAAASIRRLPERRGLRRTPDVTRGGAAYGGRKAMPGPPRRLGRERLQGV